MTEERPRASSVSSNESTGFRKAPHLKIVVIGDQNVGKTALLESYQFQKISATSKPTIGADFVKKKIVIEDDQQQEQPLNLQLWDTAGQERFQALCTSFYRGADCCIIVYDVNQRASLHNCFQWRHNFENATRVEGVPFVLVGNKTDMSESETKLSADQVQRDWISTGLCHQHFQTSALNSDNVDAMFAKAATLALEFQNQTRIYQAAQLKNMMLNTSQGGQQKGPDGKPLKLNSKGSGEKEKDDSCC